MKMKIKRFNRELEKYIEGEISGKDFDQFTKELNLINSLKKIDFSIMSNVKQKLAQELTKKINKKNHNPGIELNETELDLASGGKKIFKKEDEEDNI